MFAEWKFVDFQLVPRSARQRRRSQRAEPPSGKLLAFVHASFENIEPAPWSSEPASASLAFKQLPSFLLLICPVGYPNLRTFRTVVLRLIRSVVIASQRLLLATRFDTCSSHPAYLRGLTWNLSGFDLGPIRAINRNDMNVTTELHDLDQERLLRRRQPGLPSSHTPRPCIDDSVEVTTPAVARQIGWQGEHS